MIPKIDDCSLSGTRPRMGPARGSCRPARAGATSATGADQLLDAAHIFDRAGRQVGPAARACGRYPPALDILVDRLDPRLVGGSPADSRLLAVDPVAGADLDVSKPSSTSSLVSAMPSMPLTCDRLAHQHRVEPAAAARAPGHGAELVATLAEVLADLVVQLGRERARRRRASCRPWRCRARSRAARGPDARRRSPPVPATVLDEVTNG